MKYDEERFILAVNQYQKKLEKIKGNSVLIIVNINNKNAFFSLAPLTRAIHNVGKDVHIMCKDINLEVLNDIWAVQCDIKKKIESDKCHTMKDFIKSVDDRTEKKFSKLFIIPEVVIEAKRKGFEGSLSLDYMPSWFKKYRWNELLQTCNNILKNCYAIKKKEVLNLVFETIPKEENLDMPLDDYFDNYAIAWAMLTAAKKKCRVKLSASSPRWSLLDPVERVADLKSTLIGCEMTKNVKEDIFIKYKDFSDALGLDRLEISDAVFAIRGKGYAGKHMFGNAIGYPSPNKKTRWSSAGSMLYKFDWYPQTKLDDREPQTRLGFTSTLPINVFIKSCNINYATMRKRNKKIQEILDKCKSVRVVGEEVSGYKSDFDVSLVRRNGKHRIVKRSDSDVRYKTHPYFLKKYKTKAGMMANIPGGEAFVTPEKVVGRIIGDVVISVDRSYRIDEKKPLIVDADKKGYKILKGQKKIIAALKKKKEECWERILEYQKNKSMPQKIINTSIKNFENIGEFSINTNPKAKLCDYLIVNEKIAGMLHVALGSGYEPDKNTEYHVDIVINSPRQKLDVYGITSNGKKKWIIKKGGFVV